MPQSSVRSFILALVGALSFGCLLGCQSDEMELPTLIGKTEPTRTSSAADAHRLFDCLEAAGIPAVIDSTGGNPRVDFDLNRVSRYMVRGQNGLAVDRGYPPDYQMSDAELAFLEVATDTWRLMVDGIDMSEAYAECRNSIPYTEPWLMKDPAQEAKDRKAIAEASNKWAKCARDNGWPLVSDVQPGTPDNFQTAPSVLLPATMSVAELENLLEVCPVYDPEKYMVDGAYPNVLFEEVPTLIGQDPLAEVGGTELAELQETLHRVLVESFESPD